MRNLGLIAEEIIAWQRKQFGDKRTSLGALEHMRQEVDEAIRSMTPEGMIDPRELTDCLFLLLQACDCAGVDLEQEARAKLIKNKQRVWPDEPDESGTFQHVEGEPGVLEKIAHMTPMGFGGDE